MAEIMEFMVEDAVFHFTNFGGKEGMYNAEGVRSFGVRLDDETAAKLAAEGWNVKTTANKNNDPDFEPVNYLAVGVSYKVRPPRVVMITSTGRVHLSESEIEVLDYADIEKVDFIANSYNWDYGNRTGVKAMLKTMYVTVREDELERKYAEFKEQRGATE